ncbi:MAG: response regulator transcription factor [Clostridia bacterium]|nr:response regulator transcription factor [Clostridia bacterium]
MSYKVLVVEDDVQIRSFICFALKAEGFEYITAGSATEALEKLSEKVDLLVLDLGLPDFDGKEVIRRIREWSHMPIIVVSARDREEEKIAALDTGADDYLTKPFSASELMARIRVACRHILLQPDQEARAVIEVRDLKINMDKRLVYRGGEEIHLTPMEYKLMSMLFRNIGKVITTGSIIGELWGSGYGSDTQALRALMAGLRRKIEINPAKPEYIKTEIGVGYRLLDE